MTVRKTILIIAALTLAAVCPVHALVQVNFEGGTDWQKVQDDFAGLSFGWSGGGDVYYADIDDAVSLWPFKSDNGKQNDDWSFFISGDFAGFSDAYVARVNLTYGTGSYFAVDYSSEFDLTLKAYDSSGTFLTQSVGGANYKDHGTGMLNLRVDNPGISYLTIEAMQGNYPVASCWVIDNISSDAPNTPGQSVIPEWPSIALGIMGLGGILKLRRK